ncbi:hypothetical protein ACQP3F_33105, partial [Escherichia coli]
IAKASGCTESCEAGWEQTMSEFCPRLGKLGNTLSLSRVSDEVYFLPASKMETLKQSSDEPSKL